MHNHFRDNFVFHCGDDRLAYRVAIITGTCRTGKTLLAQLIGSMSSVEWIEEPWMPMMLPVMAEYGLMDRRIAVNTMRALSEELLNDRVLLRNANFRPNDLSSIWKVRTPSDIMARMANVNSRDDVRSHVRENDSLLLLVLPENDPFIPFFYEAFPSCKIIHVVSIGFDVAQRIEDKRWFANERLKSPLNNLLYRQFDADGLHYIPWWVEEGYERSFLDYDDYAKGLYYWTRLIGFKSDAVDKEIALRPNHYRMVRYEQLVTEVELTVQSVAEYLDVRPSGMTSMLMDGIHQDEIGVPQQYQKQQYGNLVGKAAAMLNKLGYG